ncbi:MAG: hypothetical protein AB1797_07905 [bacterium]
MSRYVIGSLMPGSLVTARHQTTRHPVARGLSVNGRNNDQGLG